MNKSIHRTETKPQRFGPNSEIKFHSLISFWLMCHNMALLVGCGTTTIAVGFSFHFCFSSERRKCNSLDDHLVHTILYRLTSIKESERASERGGEGFCLKNKHDEKKRKFGIQAPAPVCMVHIVSLEMLLHFSFIIRSYAPASAFSWVTMHSQAHTPHTNGQREKSRQFHTLLFIYVCIEMLCGWLSMNAII